MDSSDNPIPWEELNGGTDEQPRLIDFSLDDYVYYRTWTTEGKYNWKCVGENYNEVRPGVVSRDKVLTNLISVTTVNPAIQALLRLRT